MIKTKWLIIPLLIVLACESYGNLTFVGDINNSLKEVSAVEICPNSDILWVIQDSGNNNNLIGLNALGDIIKTININNVSNIDWEDLTTDNNCNIYIGDFGDNMQNRTVYTIYKIGNEALVKESTNAELIEFTLPLEIKSKDFESFILINNHFYLFSKEKGDFTVFKVPNKIGKHQAIVSSNFNFKGKNNKITSADIGPRGETLILLNHNKVWKLSNFQNDNFFSGSIEKLEFKHSSQKEGVAFLNDSTLILTDERNGTTGGNIYSFKIN